MYPKWNKLHQLCNIFSALVCWKSTGNGPSLIKRYQLLTPIQLSCWKVLVQITWLVWYDLSLQKTSPKSSSTFPNQSIFNQFELLQNRSHKNFGYPFSAYLVLNEAFIHLNFSYRITSPFRRIYEHDMANHEVWYDVGQFHSHLKSCIPLCWFCSSRLWKVFAGIF